MKRIIPFFVLLTLVSESAISQIFQNDYYNRHDTVMMEGDIFFNVQAAAFFYNNEFFNTYNKGYTLIGSNFQPQLIYQSNSKLKLAAGINLQRYFGENSDIYAKPILSIEYRPSDKFTILLGSFNGGENHRTHDAIFTFENHLTSLIENGILINYSGPIFSTETWLNWESFILPGDTIQEQFTAGSSNRVRIFKSASWELTIPFTLLAHHAGGQINNSSARVETLINVSEGLRICRAIELKFINNIFAELNVFHSLGDFIPSSGMGYSVKSGLQSEHFELNVEYFKARDFISFAGNPLYNTYEKTGNPLLPYKYGGSNEMINLKTGYRQKIGNKSYLFARLEAYYFTGRSKPDYSYSLHFQVIDFLKAGSSRKQVIHPVN